MIYFTLIITSIIAILHIITTSREKHNKLNQYALSWSLILLLWFCYLYLFSENIKQFQYIQPYDWLRHLGLYPYWGSITFILDTLSLLFIGLSILLIPICILISWNTIKLFKKEFLIAIFSILVLLIHVLAIMDLLGFYILFETILIPMFLVIGVWGSREEKVKAAYYFFFYTLIGSLLMLLSIFKIYALTGTTHYYALLHLEIPKNSQYWLFLGFFASLAVKIPMFPCHIWLPQAHVEAPIVGSVLLAAILLKLGGYGFIRFSFPLFPIASEIFSPFIIIISIIAIVYGAFTTCRQSDIKRLIAYSSVSHMGLVTMSLFTHSLEGYIASVIMMLAHGLVSSGLFMVSFTLYNRFHTRIFKYFKGLVLSTPLLSSITFILILGNISFPGTVNFVAEFSSLIAATKYAIFVGISICLGIFLGTVYSLSVYNKIYFGSLSNFTYYVRDLSALEYHSFIPLLELTLILGIIPNFVLPWLLNSLIFQISL